LSLLVGVGVFMLLLFGENKGDLNQSDTAEGEREEKE
jgi:hypothetical protein